MKKKIKAPTIKQLILENEIIRRGNNYYRMIVDSRDKELAEEKRQREAERRIMQNHINRISSDNAKVLWHVRKALASPVIIEPIMLIHKVADQTELRCNLQIAEAWASENSKKVSMLTEPKQDERPVNAIDIIIPKGFLSGLKKEEVKK